MNTKTVIAWSLLLSVLLAGSSAVWAQPAPASTDQAAPAPAPTGNAIQSEETGVRQESASTDAPAVSSGGEKNGSESGEAEKKQQPSQEAPGTDWKFMLMMGGAVVLMFLFMGRGKKKEQARRQEMLKNMKKGDRVVSIGGIIGSVVEVREDEVVIKIDDNTRMKLLRTAVSRVGEDAKKEATEDANKK